MTEQIEKILKLINERANKSPLLKAIDGRCCAGKTTLANRLSEISKYPVIHMDHFFLRPEQISAQRLSTPGENIDHELFFTEIISPIKEERCVSYKPYDCHKKMLLNNIIIPRSKIYIIEGSYSLNTHLFKYYDLKVFIDVSKDEQKRRLIKRNGLEGATIFLERWITLEEEYFSFYQIEKQCDLKL